MASQLLVMVRVAILAEDPLSRAGVAEQLRVDSGIRMVDVGEAEVALVVEDRCGESTQELLRSLRSDGLSRLVLIVRELDDAGLLAAVEAGACGVLRRAEASSEKLAHAVQAAAAGDGNLPPDLLGRLLDQVQRLQDQVLAPRGLTLTGLSTRETEVLRLLAEGFDTVEVARALCWSERTVKNTVHDITTRLQLRNRTHAVAYALRQGLI